MCGRFALYSAYPKFAKKAGVPIVSEELTPRFNVPPGTWITAIRQVSEDESPRMEELWWGYKPKWAKGKASQPINARVETVATSSYFKSAFRRHRCLVPANGWYEWDKAVTPKQPHFICREDREPLFFAGIYTEREDGSVGCAIVTEPARGSTQDVHDRMPLILDDDSLEPWLDPDLTDRETLRNVVHHIDADLITHWPVSTKVNRPSGAGEKSLINPV
nr:SOS response-associated peptidase [uncultured Halomonas sp.]